MSKNIGKRVAMILVLASLVVGLGGCNRTVFDTTYNYDRAILKLPDGTVVDGKVQSWTDYEGDQLQVKIDDTTYLVHSSNCVLISSKKQ